MPPAHINQHTALHLHPTQQTVDWNIMPEGATTQTHNNTNSGGMFRANTGPFRVTGTFITVAGH